MGIYTAFNTPNLTLTRGIEVPVTAGVKFHNLVNAKFNNLSGGVITYIINDRKDPSGTLMSDYSNGKPRLATYP